MNPENSDSNTIEIPKIPRSLPPELVLKEFVTDLETPIRIMEDESANLLESAKRDVGIETYSQLEFMEIDS